MSNENTPEFRYADETEVRVSQLMLPGAANAHGSVHGGEMLKLVDSIAYVCACRFSGGLCVLGYLVAVFSPEPLLALLGCGLCGLSVGLMWPGIFSLSSRHFPHGGTAMFALLVVLALVFG